MKLFESRHIENFPDDILLGYTEITGNLDPGILSAAERKEWEGFANLNRRNEYLTGRHLFRYLLKNSGLELSYTLRKEPLGRPFAVNGTQRLSVSFSHSGSLMLCALSREKEIGIDAERHDRPAGQALTDRILAAKERSQFKDYSPILLWTIKEAAAKCMGTGMRTNFNELILSKTPENQYLVTFNDEMTFQICSFRLTDYQISIAYQD